MRIAAIDLGSNAVRLAIAECGGPKGFEIVYKTRKSLRLGTEAFSSTGEFSQSTLKKAVETFSFFSEVMKEENVDKYKAFATSAFRDSKNSSELALAIKDVTGIKIEQMSGSLEAEVILNSVLQKMSLNPEKNYLLCDLGGGSLELSKIEQGQVTGSKSFDLGTVRLLNQLEESRTDKISKIIELYKSDVEKFLAKKGFAEKQVSIIGTGGNFKRLLKIRNLEAVSKKRYLKLEEFLDIRSRLKKLSFDERKEFFELRSDRADVIITAVEIIKFVLKDLTVSKIYAPNAGLVEGILENLSEQHCR
jgi:exopolyphosphatase/guanosine-5'-triphosphate,3'-diphosphate pyrophosphatase